MLKENKMPIYVKGYMRKGTSVKAYRRGTRMRKKAKDLVFALSGITARGSFLSKPQKKAFRKASALAARPVGYGMNYPFSAEMAGHITIKK